MRSISTVFLFTLVLMMGCGATKPAALVTDETVGAPLSMLRVQGDKIVDATGRTVTLKGVAFGNQVWQEQAVPVLHHNEVDYARLASMGMNSTRFYMNHITFEDDAAPGVYKPEGWQWIDQNIEWAKTHGIYLVLTMTHPPGGFQSTGDGDDLWENPSTQERLISLWRAIAARYRDEPVIAGYNFLNEPAVTKSREQWHELSGRIVQAVRAVDPNHMFFVERVDCTAGDWANDADGNFFKVNDANVVYEFHFYEPFQFTHQNASWVDFAEDSSVYPDARRAGVMWYDTERRIVFDKNPKLSVGDSDWTYYQGAPFTVDDSSLALMKPTLICEQNAGKAYFDDIVLDQIGPDGHAEPLWQRNLNTKRGWWWEKTGEGDFAKAPTGHGDDASLSIFGTTGEAELSFGGFRTTPGATYRLSGWMKGEHISDGAVCQLRLEFLTARVPVYGWDKDFLAAELDAYLAWGRRNHVPMYLGEFGAVRQAFEDDRGGLRWVSDMLDLLLERNVSFSYHDYHEVWMGLYFGDDTLPDPNNANTALIDLLKKRLGAESVR